MNHGNSALESVFRLLEDGKSFENSKNLEQASSSYHRACQLIRDIIKVEYDVAKRNLLIDQLIYYEEKLRSLADSVFERALSLDEKKGRFSDIESLYLQAAEQYMAYLKIKDDNSMKIRINGILDRVEEMRGVERCAAALPTVDPSRPLHLDSVRKAKEHASVPQISPSPGPLPLPPPPVPTEGAPGGSGSGDGLSAEEIAVLRGSSLISGRCFMPWLEGEEKREVFAFNKPFVDPDGPLGFSQSQMKHHPVYRRIKDICTEGQAVMIRRVSPLSIHQDLVPDCSFVCSLCIAASYEARHRKQLITAIVYPQNERGVPVINPSGKYLVKLHVNGVPRKVIVDDFLPVSAQSGRLLCSSSRDPSEMWVSVVEKAYMKLNGGYDFPGSNSGIDLHALTGWIPEQVFFSEDSSSGSLSGSKQDHRQSEDRAWERILSAHNLGDCLITISTPPMSAREEEVTGLVPGHAYAVLNVQSAGNLRMLQVGLLLLRQLVDLMVHCVCVCMLQVKNPWARQTWRGRFSSMDRDTWTPGLRQALGVSPEDFDKMDEHGIFWIEFGDCRRVFRSFFLNCTKALSVINSMGISNLRSCRESGLV
jgi:calpain-7